MIPPTTDGAIARPNGERTGELRTDIQALRAIAVGAVLLYHLWPNRLTGGYVGVDVFFAISGFLITSHLLREIARTGTVRIGRFWARRAKRLLPGSLLVLALVAVAVVTIVPDIWRRQFLEEIVASTLYVQNWLLAANSVDYLELENAASPTQHFWTLSVEEQFYIALPLILAAVVLVSRRRGSAVRPIMGTVIALIAVASLAYSIWLTTTEPSVAYFSTLTRAWEFGAGALLAFVTATAGRRASRALPVLGVAMIAAASVLYSSETPFPGFAAALPVLGTLLVLWAGSRSVVARIGAWRPVAILGEISYAVYLWHWPLVVLVPQVTGRPLSTLDKLLIIAATLIIAWLSTRYVEEPIRFSPRLLGGARRPMTVAAWSVGAMVLVAGCSAADIVRTDLADRARVDYIASVKADPPDCFGAQAMDPLRAPCENADLEPVLVPLPAVAKKDDDNLADCWGMQTRFEAKVCTVVEPVGYTLRVLAVGDSHNNSLIGAYRMIGQSQGWRVDVAGIPGCYLTTAEQKSFSSSHHNACLNWRASVTDTIRADRPDVVIVTHSSGDNLVIPRAGETVESATISGMVEAWSALPELPIIAIRDNPSMTRDTAACVARHGLDAAVECARPRSEALSGFDGQAEAVARVPNARLVDMTEMYCTPDECAPVIGNVLVYRDARHITSTWARTLAPYLEREIVAALSH